MPKLELTDKTIKASRVPEGAKKLDLFDTLAKGLVLRVNAGGSRIFYLVYSDAQARRVWHKIGEYAPDLTLSVARDKARALRGQVQGGKDPQAEKRAQQAAMTVFDMVEAYLARAVSTRRSVDEIARRLRKNVSGKDSTGKKLENASAGVIGDVKLHDLHRRDLTRCIDAIVDRGAGVEANRVYEDIRALVRWARGRGDLDENLTEAMRPPTETVERERLLTEDEIKAVWHELPDADMRESTRRIIRLCLLTAQRVGEVSGMTKGELCLTRKLWTIPAARAKNKREHTVPLSDLSIAIIREQMVDVEELAARKDRDVPDPIFPAPGFRGEVTAGSIPKALKRLEIEGRVLGVPAFTPHDLRRTAATGMEALGINPFVIGHILNHVSAIKSTITSSVYARYDYEREQREALDMWADRVEAITSGTASKVIPMRR